MTDDLIPEEREQEYNDLLAVLRNASQRRVLITASEQTQIRTRVQARLAQATSASSFPNEVAFTQKGQSVPNTPMAHRRKLTRFVSNLLVALVVIGISSGLIRPQTVLPSPPQSVERALALRLRLVAWRRQCAC
jgi:hypothetical protein